jgi:hypothetical protein
MKNLLEHLRVVLVWSMLPLAAWSGVPATGCICADGHYKAFCTAGRCRSTKEHLAHITCTCCAAVEPHDDHHSSCQRATECCHKSSDNIERESLGVTARTACCTPVMSSANNIPSARVTAPSDDFSMGTIDLALSDVAPLQAGERLRPAWNDTGPPPHDLVVALRRLVI